jgi:hypothetical protein
MPPALKSHQAGATVASKTNSKTKKSTQKVDSTFSSQKAKRGKDKTLNEDEQKASQALSKRQKAAVKNLEKEKHESKLVTRLVKL